MDFNRLIIGDAEAALRDFPDNTFHACVTSPPYWGQRDYGADDQLGRESQLYLYIQRLVEVFQEVRRVLRPDGTLWLNIGDTYRNKGLVGVPWEVAFALRGDGWHLRSDCIWHKTNVRPESVKDRPTHAHEYLFLFSKSKRYYYDADSIREEAVGQNHHDLTGGRYAPSGQTAHTGSRKQKKLKPGRNRRTVWSIPTRPYKGAHDATFPPALVEPCIRAGCPEGGVVLDPFMGSGTTAQVATELGRSWVGIDIDARNEALVMERVRTAQPRRFG